MQILLESYARGLTVMCCAQKHSPASVTAEATLDPASLTASGVFWFALESPAAHAMKPFQTVAKQLCRRRGPHHANMQTMTG